MQARAFRAATTHEALALVSREFGPDALILETRRAPASRHVEVLAVPASRGSWEPGLLPALLAHGVDLSFALELALSPHPAQALGARLGRLRLLEWPRDRRVMAVGPTGAGKTTALAKLAARARSAYGCRVGLVNLDTVRPGAQEQGRILARLLDLEIATCEPARLPGLLGEWGGRVDLVLADTPGRNPLQPEQCEQLEAMVASFSPQLLLGVIPVTMDRQDALRWGEVLRDLGCGALLFTKLDESERWGLVLEMVAKTGLPLSYLTSSQDLWEGLEPAAPEVLVRRLLGEAA
ncbi:MAG: hypothetical protein QME93_01940 [Bacillota bacterium]|nr:hypothetical protein [Bacillota bacterium]MDI7248813.1 hypothetical protein [Bacillota bacterium]